ncbi:MAG: DUF58 domain-containing protein [Thermoprotei archaeon]
MYTKRLLLFIIVIVLALFFALIAEEWKLYIVVIVLLSELGLSVLNMPDNININADFKIDGERFYLNDETIVNIVAHNKGSPAFVKIFLKVPSGVQLEGYYGLITRLNHDEIKNFNVKIRFVERGKFNIGPVSIIAQDPLGFISKVIDVPVVKKIVVFPSLNTRGTLMFQAKRTGVWPGSIISKRLGSSMEFHALRDYIPGDDIKRINWKASARFRKIISNEYESENVTDAVVVIDANGLTNRIDYEKMTLEACVSGAATLSYGLLAQGNRVGLICLGGTRNWVKPGFGKKQLLKILYTLSEVKAGKELPVDQVLLILAPFMLKPGSHIFFISPLMDSSIINAVKDLVNEGYIVTVIFAFCDSTTANPFLNLPIEILNLERMLILHSLSPIANTIIWNCKPDIMKTLSSSKQPLRRRYYARY